jgi:hypothetical protein
VGRGVLVSKKKHPVASVNRRVAVRSSRLVVGFDRFIDRRKRKLAELAHVALLW